jgi:hypothetical protein
MAQKDGKPIHLSLSLSLSLSLFRHAILLLLPAKIKMPSFCQDRLGTDIEGKHSQKTKRELCFSQGEIVKAQLSEPLWPDNAKM